MTFSLLICRSLKLDCFLKRLKNLNYHLFCHKPNCIFLAFAFQKFGHKTTFSAVLFQNKLQKLKFCHTKMIYRNVGHFFGRKSHARNVNKFVLILKFGSWQKIQAEPSLVRKVNQWRIWEEKLKNLHCPLVPAEVTMIYQSFVQNATILLFVSIRWVLVFRN